MSGAIGAVAATVDLAKLPRSLSPTVPRDPASVRLDRPLPPAPGEPLLCGEYGPRFVGYGPMPAPTLAQRAAPWALGILCGVAALGIEHMMGRL